MQILKVIFLKYYFNIILNKKIFKKKQQNCRVESIDDKNMNSISNDQHIPFK